MNEVFLPIVWEYIDNNVNKQTMMRSIAKYWSPGSKEYVLIEKAYIDSYKGHGYDTRDSGERYFRHVLGVVSILLYLFDKGFVKKDYELIIAAFLHDLPEDKGWALGYIERTYGKKVRKLVAAVTKPPYNQKFGYKNSEEHSAATMAKVKKGGYLAIVLKLADRLHNMLTLWEDDWQRRENKIKETIEKYLPLASIVKVLRDELLIATSMQAYQNNLLDPREKLIVVEVGRS